MKHCLARAAVLLDRPLKLLLELSDVHLADQLMPKPPARMSANHVVWMDAMHFALVQTPPLVAFTPITDVWMAPICSSRVERSQDQGCPTLSYFAEGIKFASQISKKSASYSSLRVRSFQFLAATFNHSPQWHEPHRKALTEMFVPALGSKDAELSQVRTSECHFGSQLDDNGAGIHHWTAGVECRPRRAAAVSSIRRDCHDSADRFQAAHCYSGVITVQACRELPWPVARSDTGESLMSACRYSTSAELVSAGQPRKVPQSRRRGQPEVCTLLFTHALQGYAHALARK